VGYAARVLSGGEAVAAVAVANAFGDVVGQDGELLGAPRGEHGELVRTADRLAEVPAPPEPLSTRKIGNTTLACVLTDASLDKRGCAIVTRMASAGIPRAVDPSFTPLDGDVVFCLASGSAPAAPPGLAATWTLAVLGSVAAAVTSEAIRDAVHPRW
jgi:D-aminopeptidase